MRTAVVSAVAAAVLAGCAGGLPAPGAPRAAQARPPATAGGAETSVAIVHEGWHTGLVLPAKALGSSRLGLRPWFPDARYLVFGWGDRSFYMAPHPGAATALSALFPSASVLYIRGLRNKPRTAFPRVGELHWVCVSSGELSRLAVYLNAYLRKRSTGSPIELGTGPLPDSRFFASTGTYDAFRTCNTWTTAALAFAGLPVSANGVVFAGQAMSEVGSLPACRRKNAAPPAPVGE